MSSDHHSHVGDDRRRLAASLALIVMLMAAELSVAVVAHSLALVADAAHLLVDAGAVGGAMWAVRLSARPVSARWSYGLKRAEILSAAVNGVALVGVAGVVLVQAVQRLVHPVAVTGSLVLVMAVVGVVINIGATTVLSGADRSSLNIQGALRHIATDAAGYLATAVAAAVIITTGFRRADPVASLVVVGLMAWAAWTLLAASGHVLLEGTPEGVDLEAVRAHLLASAEHVRDVHDLHAWVLTSDSPAISAHVVVADSCFRDGHAPQILDALQSALIGEFDVEHSTLQLEMASHSEHELGAH
ncbi:MAG TPA: cation diffusion facilitator family transporter [Acidimicrobiales bacterium]|nr:cation diffusion facilitator family transporter [Acidimicrobiales bacterium]